MDSKQNLLQTFHTLQALYLRNRVDSDEFYNLQNTLIIDNHYLPPYFTEKPSTLYFRTLEEITYRNLFEEEKEFIEIPDSWKLIQFHLFYLEQLYGNKTFIPVR